MVNTVEIVKNDTMMIGGKEVEIQEALVLQRELKYYPENPRIYSIVYIENVPPTQEEIEERLIEKDHVKQLYHSIKANGGLTDPLIVKNGDFTVFEGNSRLAAYRMLAKENPIKWGKARCRLLPEDIDEKLIFNLLGQYHIIGRQDWAPFEQAGYLWRRNKKYETSPLAMAKEMGISPSRVNSLIKVYDFMVMHDDLNVQRWSYYDEYLKISKPKRAKFKNSDQIIVNKIKTGEIEKAADIRDKVKVIFNVKGKVGTQLVTKFLSKPNALQACVDTAVARGANSQLLKRLEDFREYVNNPDIIEVLKGTDVFVLQKCEFELKKIQQATEIMNKKVANLIKVKK